MEQSKQQGWVYEQQGVVVYRASSLGGCIASLVAARMGETASPPGEKLQASMDASSAMEKTAIKEYENRRATKVIWQQKEVVLQAVEGFESYPPIAIVGHIDGLDQQSDDGLEVKSFSARNFSLYDNGGLDALGSLGRKYLWQGAIYGHALKRKMRFVIYNKGATSENDLMIIEPAVDASELVTLDEIWERIRFVEDCAANDVMPECDAGCTKFDAYGHVHIFPAVNVESAGGELNELLAEYMSVKGRIEELTAQKEELAKVIKEQYAPGTHVAGSYTANIAKVRSNRFDTTAFKKHHGELYEQFLVPTETIRLTVKEKGGSGGED